VPLTATEYDLPAQAAELAATARPRCRVYELSTPIGRVVLKKHLGPDARPAYRVSGHDAVMWLLCNEGVGTFVTDLEVEAADDDAAVRRTLQALWERLCDMLGELHAECERKGLGLEEATCPSEGAGKSPPCEGSLPGREGPRR
jgi:hypothetical protein